MASQAVGVASAALVVDRTYEAGASTDHAGRLVGRHGIARTTGQADGGRGTGGTAGKTGLAGVGGVSVFVR